MNRLKLLATATLMALAFTACDEGAPPPVEPPPPPTPVGTISGSVTIDGTAAAGITATLSSGATQTTAAGGTFAFSGVEAGTYTVTISGFPEDATFAQVTQSATIATEGQNVQLNFAGEYIRSSAVVGSVVAADAMMSGGDGQPETLAGVTVTLDGEHAMGETMETGMDGGFAFTGLRSGTYTVTISDFPEDVSFETVSVEVEVDVGDVGQADFTGHYIRTSAVEGQVIIDGGGLQGVTVTLIGGPADENFTMMTDVDGMYRFEDLRPGDYTVSISDFDTRDYEFAATSQDVSVDLDETGTVSFTGVLLRTSGISGGVSVEGMGLEDIEVTLSGAADATTMTDAGGQYAFAGLAAGDYTVSIAVDDPAYVFDSMSQDVTVGDDDAQRVSFLGQHARTASVSGQLFLDELDKNNMMDAGETPLLAAGVPVALVGPGVNDQRLSATGPDGSFGFSGLRAGSYQLVVPIDATAAAALAANDVAYGGPGTGYAFALGVGETKSQAIPFDITHTTVAFSVSLRSGDEMGDALPGAMVTLYGTGGANVGSETTGDDGSAVIKVARAMTSGNMVNAAVSAEGYSVAEGMTAVSWDPQMFATAGANSNDIVNLNVDVSISGATVDRGDYGGGEPLAGWALTGDGPSELGDDGTATFTTTVDAVPASFSFAVADDQDDDLDGGEMYESSGGSYTHTGLSVAGNMDADPIVVTYTTQTLKVYVHQELDQVRGYTGNVLGGDRRASGLVDIEVRQASGNDGRSTSPISNDDWDARANSWDSKGVYTFAHLPADMDVVVHATARDGYMLLDLHGLDTYRNKDENGLTGGAFGAMGGWSSEVELCPLKAVDPTEQDHGDCASFGVVTTHEVTANVSKVRVRKAGAGFHSSDPSSTSQSGVTVSLTPIPGKNLAGIGGEFTTAKSDDPTTTINEKSDHNFGTMAAGAYKLDLLPAGAWRGMVTDAAGAAASLSPLGTDAHIAVTPTTAIVYGFVRATDGFGLANVTVNVNGQSATTDDLGRYIVSGIKAVRGKVFLNTARVGYPAAKADSTSVTFAANTATQHNFTLSGANNTVAITGTVTESGSGDPLPGVVIKVDGNNPLNAGTGQGSGTLKTGADGTYTAIVAVQPNNDPLVMVKPSKDGYDFIPEETPVAAIAGANPSADFTGYAVTEIVGRVTGPGGGMPLAEVTVTAHSGTPMTAANELDEVTTTETGTFSVDVPTLSGTVYLQAVPRQNISPMDPNYVNLENARKYTWFDPPATRAGGQIAVIPGQTLQFGTFTGNSVQPRITGVRRGTVKTDVELNDPDGDGVDNPIVPNRGATPGNPGGVGTRTFDLIEGEPGDTIVVSWAYETFNAFDNTDATSRAASMYSAEDADGSAGGSEPTLEADAAVAAADIATPVSNDTNGRGTAGANTTVRHTRTTTYIIPAGGIADYGEIDLTIGHNVIDADVGAAAEATGVREDFAAVDGSIRGLAAPRDITVNPGARNEHEVSATWFGAGSPQLEHRIALLVQVEVPGGPTQSKMEWVVFNGGGEGGTTATVAQPAISRATAIPGNTGANFGRWTSADFDLNLETNAAGDWLDDDDSDLVYSINVDNLRNASHFRIDTKVDGGSWVKHAPVAITPGAGG